MKKRDRRKYRDVAQVSIVATALGEGKQATFRCVKLCLFGSTRAKQYRGTPEKCSSRSATCFFLAYARDGKDGEFLQKVNPLAG
jgi:hypothetical protein